MCVYMLQAQQMYVYDFSGFKMLLREVSFSSTKTKFILQCNKKFARNLIYGLFIVKCKHLNILLMGKIAKIIFIMPHYFMCVKGHGERER
jgi:hypothetical protein